MHDTTAPELLTEHRVDCTQGKSPKYKTERIGNKEEMKKGQQKTWEQIWQTERRSCLHRSRPCLKDKNRSANFLEKNILNRVSLKHRARHPLSSRNIPFPPGSCRRPKRLSSYTINKSAQKSLSSKKNKEEFRSMTSMYYINIHVFKRKTDRLSNGILSNRADPFTRKFPEHPRLLHVSPIFFARSVRRVLEFTHSPPPCITFDIYLTPAPFLNARSSPTPTPCRNKVHMVHSTPLCKVGFSSDLYTKTHVCLCRLCRMPPSAVVSNSHG